MNGIHDMGGMHGYGRVEVEPDEPVFHGRWEGRVFGMVQSLGGGNIDAGRHSIERLDPVAYLRHGYYGRWFAALERTLAEFGVVAREELEARLRARRRRTSKAGSRARGSAAATRWQPPRGESYARDVDRPALFREAQEVRTRNLQPAGHTRLPAYTRCKRGTIERVHAAMVYPDDHAHGRGENPQYLYTVRFDGRELWGQAAEPGTVLLIDLFEPYLEAP
jgi:nitrile hydratase